MSLLLLVIGRVLYGVSLPARHIPALIVTLAFGAIALSAVGICYSGLIPSFDAAPAMTNAVVLPLYFISGVFVQDSLLPRWLSHVAGVFPIKPLNEALFACFNPRVAGAGFQWSKLAVLAAWGVVALLDATRAFSWVPRRDAE